MRPFSAIVIVLITALLATAAFAGYDSKGALRVLNVELSGEQPAGRRGLVPIEGDELEAGEGLYVYVELDNCRAEKEKDAYHTRLAMAMDIYFEDGPCIFSAEDVNVTDHESKRLNTKDYMWAKIETNYLKPGEYKIEMTIRDENSGKETFALTRFRIR